MGPQRWALKVYSRAGVFRNDAHFQAEVIYLLAGNVLGVHGQEGSVSTQESPKNAIRWVRGLLKRLLLSRLNRELPAHKLRNQGGCSNS